MAKVTEKTLVGFIDMTPTWRQLVPVLVTLIEHGNGQGRATAISELERMACAADQYNAIAKTAGRDQ